RTPTFTHTGTDLTSLTDADGNSRTFTYSTSQPHLLTGDQWAPWNTRFEYDDSTAGNKPGQLIQVNLGAGSVYDITPQDSPAAPMVQSLSGYNTPAASVT